MIFLVHFGDTNIFDQILTKNKGRKIVKKI
jgi:hypothetical protein